MVVQVPTPPVRYMLRLNFSLGLGFFFSIVVHYSYGTERTQLNGFFFNQHGSVPFHLPNFSFCRKSSHNICESANITFTSNPSPPQSVFVYFLPCELTKGKFSIKSYFWWLVFIPKADNDRQVLLVGLGKTELTTLLDPLPSGTHFPRQYHQPLKAKSVHILQPDFYTSTRLRIVIQQTWFDATLVYRFNECNRRSYNS